MNTQTMERRLRERILRRIAASKAKNDAGVALLSALLFMIIMAGLGVIIVSTVLGQAAPTFLAQKETQSVYGAQAGMQAALGMLRNAVDKVGGVVQYDPNGDGAVLGNPALLPCNTFTGTADPGGTADGVGYSVTIAYYDADPTGQSNAWLTKTVAKGGDLLPCTSGSGVTSTAANPLEYALLTSTGTGNAVPGDTSSADGDRALSAVYEFEVSTYNVVGGLINDYDDNGAYCLEAVSAKVGSKILLEPASQCTTANAALEDWSYGSDYEIKLASTTANSAAGLCITGPTSTSLGSPQTALLATCIASNKSTRWDQLWAWFGDNTWEGSTSSINGLSGWYLGFASKTPLTGQPLTVSTSEDNAFSPSTEVGAGAASTSTYEIVNYEEFGRCMDVTNQTIATDYPNYTSSDSPFLISYPCKQDPDTSGAGITWNQKFYYTEPTEPASSYGPEAIVVNNDGASRPNSTLLSQLPTSDQYCLTTPGYPTTLATAGAIPYVFACSSTTNYKEWTRVFNVSGDYPDSYLFTTKTSGGATLCLEVNPTLQYKGWSELDVAACDGTNLYQKWNAPAGYTASGPSGYKEVDG